MVEEKKDSQFPDYSKASSEDMFNVLMAMRGGQPEEALRKAEEKLPKLPEEPAGEK